MLVEEIMSVDPERCYVDDPLHEVIERMRARDCGFIPVVDEHQQVIGVVTDRDIALTAADRLLALDELVVSSAMTRDAICCAEDDVVAGVEQTMRAAQIRRVPVVDEDGYLIGVLSLNDVALAINTRRLEEAADVATTLAGISEHRL